MKPAKSKRSIWDDFGGKSTEGVVIDKIINGGHSITFSLRNHLRQDVKNVHFYIIFYDRLNDPIDVQTITFKETIPAGLAKRYWSNFIIDNNVVKMVQNGGSVKFRILDFEIVE